MGASPLAAGPFPVQVSGRAEEGVCFETAGCQWVTSAALCFPWEMEAQGAWPGELGAATVASFL